MIHEHLLKTPGLLGLVMIHDNQSTLGAAFSALHKEGPNAPYIRILIPAEDCQAIMARNLNHYRDVALCIARHRETQYQNYAPPKTEIQHQLI